MLVLVYLADTYSSVDSVSTLPGACCHVGRCTLALLTGSAVFAIPLCEVIDNHGTDGWDLIPDYPRTRITLLFS